MGPVEITSSRTLKIPIYVLSLVWFGCQQGALGSQAGWAGAGGGPHGWVRGLHPLSLHGSHSLPAGAHLSSHADSLDLDLDLPEAESPDLGPVQITNVKHVESQHRAQNHNNGQVT